MNHNSKRRGPDLNSPNLHSEHSHTYLARRGVYVDLNSRGGVQTSTLLTSTLLRGPNDGEGLLCVCWPRHIPHTSSTDSISAVHTSPPHQRVVVPHHLPSTYHTLSLETHYILPECTTHLKKSNAPPATRPPHINLLPKTLPVCSQRLRTVHFKCIDM